jgi:hypothetical protein
MASEPNPAPTAPESVDGDDAVGSSQSVVETDAPSLGAIMSMLAGFNTTLTSLQQQMGELRQEVREGKETPKAAASSTPDSASSPAVLPKLSKLSSKYGNISCMSASASFE